MREFHDYSTQRETSSAGKKQRNGSIVRSLATAAVATVCLLEGVAIGVLLALVRKRESAQNG